MFYPGAGPTSKVRVGDFSNIWQSSLDGFMTVIEMAVYGKKSFLSKESDIEILHSIYFAYDVGIISSYSNRTKDIRLRCSCYVEFIIGKSTYTFLSHRVFNTFQYFFVFLS